MRRCRIPTNFESIDAGAMRSSLHNYVRKVVYKSAIDCHCSVFYDVERNLPSRSDRKIGATTPTEANGSVVDVSSLRSRVEVKAGVALFTIRLTGGSLHPSKGDMQFETGRLLIDLDDAGVNAVPKLFGLA